MHSHIVAHPMLIANFAYGKTMYCHFNFINEKREFNKF